MYLQKVRPHFLKFVLAGLLLVSLYSCNRDDEERIIVEESSPEFRSAQPSIGTTIRPYTDITIYFNNGKPDGLTVSEGTFTSTQDSITVSGPFDPGNLELRVTWEGGSQTLKYVVNGALFSHVEKPTDTLINPFTDIILVFKGNPENVSVSHGTPVTSGNEVTVEGPFKVVGDLDLDVVWADDSVTLPFLVSDDPVARINEVSVDHNVFEDNKKGMRIFVSFQAWHMPFEEGRVIMYFYFRDGRRLENLNNQFGTNNGQVACGRDFTPGFFRSVYTDRSVFMPYSELHLIGSGRFLLHFETRIHHKGRGKFIEVSMPQKNFHIDR